MGCLSSKPTSPEAARSSEIDVQLKHAKELTKNDIKLLMLGAGESGKTTIKQQMRAIEGQRMTEGERDQFTDICRTNMVSSLQIILDNMSLMGLTLADASLQGQAELITGLVNENGNVGISPEDGELLPGVKEALLNLWRDASVQATYARSNEYQLNDSADYFLDNAERICQRGWRPNDMDVLKARVKTTGISETRFSKQGKNFVVVDVGGQRSERKKWLYCFEDVTALIYVVALNEYNMTLREDEGVNRMHEALMLYHSIVSSPYFRTTPIMLLLNKADLLRKKCRSGVPSQMIDRWYPEFTGDPGDWKAVFRFIERMFLSQSNAHTDPDPDPTKTKSKAPPPTREKRVYSHMCTAVDQNDMRAVLGRVTEIVLSNNLKATGLIG